jgi:RNA polymerase sigma factor for flagellar operon FliA
MSYGTNGLIKSWENFDPKRGVKFKVFASYRIRGEMLDKIRKEWKYQNPGGYKTIHGTESKVAQAALDTNANSKDKSDEETIRDVASNSAVAYLLSIDDVYEEAVTGDDLSLDESVTSQIDFSTEKQALWGAVKNLAEDEKKIVKLFYIDDRSQKEIAKELGYSKSKISRMHALILKKLKLRLQRDVSYSG